MSIKTITQPPFLVDTAGEMNTSWPDGSLVFCKSNNCMYELNTGVFAPLSANYLYKAYDITTTSGTKVIYLTNDGLVGGTPLFSTVDFVHVVLTTNDPNFGKSYTLSGVTLTITAQKQTFNVVTLLSTNLFGSATLAAAPNGTALKVLIQGTPA